MEAKSPSSFVVEIEELCRRNLAPAEQMKAIKQAIAQFEAIYVDEQARQRMLQNIQARLRAARQLQIAKALSFNQLKAMLVLDIPEEDMFRIANLNSKARIEEVVGEVILHRDVDKAIRETEPKEGLTAAAVLPAESELSDSDWLAIACHPVRSKLQDPSAFDRDALFWRRDQKERQGHRLFAKGELLKSRGAGYSPLVNLTLRVLCVDHPSRWLLCAVCFGQNVENPYCLECNGCGYRVKTRDMPSKR